MTIKNSAKGDHQNIHKKTLISFILPIYNESKNIYKLWEELQNLRNEIKSKYECEFIFVNDGSRDDSLQKLIDIYQEQSFDLDADLITGKYGYKVGSKFDEKLNSRDTQTNHESRIDYLVNSKNIKIIDFARNFGHQIAVTAGQDIAIGRAVIIMDADLQDPPMICLEMLKKWEEGYEVVYAQRKKYKTNWFKESTAYVFYRLMAQIANVKIPVDTGDFRLLDYRVNREMCKFREKNRFLRGISSLVGFKQTSVLFDRSERYAGKPGYTFWKSLKLAIDGITSFSLFPLRLITIMGFVFAFLGFFGGLMYVLYSYIFSRLVGGWASTIIIITFLQGLQLIMMGIMSEYMGRIYIESLNRPMYTVSRVWGNTDEID